MPLHGCVKQGWRPQSITAGFGKLATVSTKHVSLLPKWPSCHATPISLPRVGRAKNTTTAAKMAQTLQAESYNHTENIHKQRKTTISVAVDLCCCWFLLLLISVAVYFCYCLFLLLPSVAVDVCCCWFGRCRLLLLLISVGVAVDFGGCWFLLLFFDCCCWFLSQKCLGGPKKRLCGHATIGLKEGQNVSQITYYRSYCTDENKMFYENYASFRLEAWRVVFRAPLTIWCFEVSEFWIFV